MKLQKILNYIIEHYPNVKFEVNKSNGLLTVIGYFHDLQSIKRELFNNSDYARIEKTNTSLYKLIKTTKLK